MKRLTALELARRLHRSNTARQFGFLLESASARRVRLRMRVRAHHKQVHNVVHGGILAALVDTAGGLATYMSVPRGARVATIEMKMNFLEPVERGSLIAEARVLRCGKHFSVVDCDVTDSARRLIATALMTFAYSMPEAAGGSRES